MHCIERGGGNQREEAQTAQDVAVCAECGHPNNPPPNGTLADECIRCGAFLIDCLKQNTIAQHELSGKKGETREFWDANPCGLSSSWEKTRNDRFNITDPYLTHYLTEERFKDRSVLEIGCGQGADADIITRHCHRYVGVDLSPQSVQIARREVGKRQPVRSKPVFLNADAEDLPFRDGKFDFVYSIGVLHHTPDFLAAVNEAHRVLAPDGRIMLMLYRSYTPLWVVLHAVRGSLRIPWIGPWIRNRTLRSLRSAKSRDSESSVGTALLELMGCPIINTFTLRRLRRVFEGRFVIDEVNCHRVGFDQVIRCVPRFVRWMFPRRPMIWCEQRLRRWLGFYLVVTAHKSSKDA